MHHKLFLDMDIINSYYYFESNPKNETMLNILRESFAHREYQIRKKKYHTFVVLLYFFVLFMRGVVLLYVSS